MAPSFVESPPGSSTRSRFVGLAQSADPKQQHRFVDEMQVERSATSDPMLKFGLAPASSLAPALRAFSGGSNPVTKSNRNGHQAGKAHNSGGLPSNFPSPQVPTDFGPSSSAHQRFGSSRHPLDGGSPVPRAPKFLAPQAKHRQVDALEKSDRRHRRSSNNDELLRMVAPALWNPEDGVEEVEGEAKQSQSARVVGEAAPEEKVRQLYAHHPHGSSSTRVGAGMRRRSMEPQARVPVPPSEDGGAMSMSSRTVSDWMMDEGGVASYREPLELRRGSGNGDVQPLGGGRRHTRNSLTGDARPGKLQPLDRRSTTNTGEGRASVGSRRNLEQQPRRGSRDSLIKVHRSSTGEASGSSGGLKKQFQRNSSFGTASVASAASSNGKPKARLGLRGGMHNSPMASRVEEEEEEAEEGAEGGAAEEEAGVPVAGGGRKQMLSFDAAQQMALERAEGGQIAVKQTIETAAAPDAPKSQWGIAAVDLRKKFSVSLEEETEQAEVNVEDLTYRLECACDSGYLNITYNQWPEMPDQVAVFMQNKATALLTLNYEGNQTAAIPDVFASMTRLVSLNLGANALRALPPSLACLANLGSLSLEKNRLETLPESMGECSSLTYLDLSHNRLHWLPKSLCNLKQLLTIKVTHNQLCHLPEQICEMTSLREINASHNVITGVPLQIARLPQLELLRLNHNKLTAIPDTMGGLWRSLLELELDHNDISVLPISLSACKKIEVLELGSNPMVLPPLEVVQEGTKRVMEYLSSSSGAVAQDPRYGWMRTAEEGGAKRQNIANIVSRLTKTIERNRSRKKAAEKPEEAADPECGVCIKLMVEMKQRDEEIAALLEKLHEKEEQVEEVQRDCNEYRGNMLRKQNRLREVEDKLYSLTVDRDKESRRGNALEAELSAARLALDDAEAAAARSGVTSGTDAQHLTELKSANAALAKRNAALESSVAAEKAAAAESAAQAEKSTRAAEDAKKAADAERGAAVAREESLLAEIERLKAALGPGHELHHTATHSQPSRRLAAGVATSKKYASSHAPTHTVVLNADAMFGSAGKGR